MGSARGLLGMLAAAASALLVTAALVPPRFVPDVDPSQSAAAWTTAIAVPTLGEWGVVFLALSIITTAWLMARRARAHETGRDRS
jgi:hypothetical protein